MEWLLGAEDFCQSAPRLRVLEIVAAEGVRAQQRMKWREEEESGLAAGGEVDGSQFADTRSIVPTRESGGSQFGDVGNVSCLEWTHLVALQGDKRHRVAIVAYKLHLERRAIPMHQNGCTYIPALQTVSRKIAG